MQHLDVERIASFDHDSPTTDELAHLAHCRVCRTERAALDSLSQMAIHAVNADTAQPSTRLTSWERLSVELRREGLITSVPSTFERETIRGALSESGAAQVFPFVKLEGFSRDKVMSEAVPDLRTKSRSRGEWWRVAAAAVLLVGSGAVLGRISAGAAALPGATATRGGAGAASVLGGIGLGSTGFGSIGEATRLLNNSERDFEHASLWLAANDTATRSSDLVRRRLATLDQLVSASRAGLAESPNDDVLNHYYLAARAMREATLQQLGGALPVGRSIERF